MKVEIIEKGILGGVERSFCGVFCNPKDIEVTNKLTFSGWGD